LVISFYQGVAARRPFPNRSTSWVPAANPFGTFLHVRSPLLPYVVAWLLPLPGMRCVRVQPAHWSPPLLSCKPCNLPCLSFALAWLIVQNPDTSSCTPRVRAWTHGPFNCFFQPCTCCACVWLLHRWPSPCMHTTRIGHQFSHPTLRRPWQVHFSASGFKVLSNSCVTFQKSVHFKLFQY
jgi:hypothetical protein